MVAPDAAAVEAANEEFYAAFEACDLDRMEAVWAHGAHVRCVHPGWDALEGWAAVRVSWARIFDGAHAMTIRIDRVQVRAAGDVAWVSCIERLMRRAIGGVVSDSVVATNVFERDGDRWRMVHHHGSPVLRPTPRTSDAVN